MIILTINNSYSNIIGLNPKNEKELRNKLSYIVGGTNSYFSKYGPRKTSLLGKRGDFPSGLLHRVKQFLKEQNLEFKVKDVRIKP